MEQGNLSTALLRSLSDFEKSDFLDNALPLKQNLNDVIKELKNPNGRIAIDDGDILISNLIRRSKNESLCVFSSNQFNAQGSCLLQHLFLSSNNLKEALFFLEKYALLISDNLELQITETHTQGVRLELPVLPDCFMAAPRHRTEILVSTLISWIQLLCGQQWRPQAIDVPFPATQYKAMYEQYWLSNVHFNAESCGITFAKSWLEAEVNQTNPHVQTTIRRDVEDEFRKLARTTSLADRIYIAFINKKVRLNDNQQQVADVFHISARTLNRHLKRDNTTLKQIVTQVRIEMAKKMLIESKFSIEQISEELGLSGRRTLDRIFIKELGISPAKYKQQHDRLKSFKSVSTANTNSYTSKLIAS